MASLGTAVVNIMPVMDEEAIEALIERVAVRVAAILEERRPTIVNQTIAVSYPKPEDIRAAALRMGR